MRLRLATPDDASAIATLHAENWRRAYRGVYADAYLDGPVVDDRQAVWRERFATPDPTMYVLVAEDGGDRLVGFACSFGNDDPTWGTLLDNLHVASGAEGHGIGRRLVAASAQWSERACPGAGFYLWVLEANARGRRFYEHIGATHAGAERTETPGGPVMSLRYVWRSIAPLRQYHTPEVDPPTG